MCYEIEKVVYEKINMKYCLKFVRLKSNIRNLYDLYHDLYNLHKFISYLYDFSLSQFMK